MVRSLVHWGGLTVVVFLLAMVRGFRLEVSANGFSMWRTWCGVPYWRVTVPLDARVEAAGGFGDPPDRVIIERELHSDDIAFGSRSTCEALCAAVKAAQQRWRRSES